MPLTGELVEEAFIQAARLQENGQPFDWVRLARLLNERLADRRDAALGDRRLLDWHAR